MNRQTKRQMARQGSDKARPPEKRSPSNPQVERTGPKQYFGEVRGEMKKVAWPPRSEIMNSSLIVLVGLVVMTSLIFVYDWAAVHIVNFVFK
jgi:preprotein translocase subunit SecE